MDSKYFVYFKPDKVYIDADGNSIDEDELAYEDGFESTKEIKEYFGAIVDTDNCDLNQYEIRKLNLTPVIEAKYEIELQLKEIKDKDDD